MSNTTIATISSLNIPNFSARLPSRQFVETKRERDDSATKKGRLLLSPSPSPSDKEGGKKNVPIITVSLPSPSVKKRKVTQETDTNDVKGLLHIVNKKDLPSNIEEKKSGHDLNEKEEEPKTKVTAPVAEKEQPTSDAPAKPRGKQEESKTKRTGRQIEVGGRVFDLSPDQNKVVDAVAKGQNVFFTGKAGTGKSLVIKAIVKELESNHKLFYVTATTGSASSLVSGSTVHSVSGFGFFQDTDKEYMIQQASQYALARKNGKNDGRRPHKFDNLAEVDTLIIDEISMMSACFMDTLDEFLRITRRNSERPFGGLQIIVCGDFFQLPPVVKTSGPGASRKRGDETYLFAFDSKVWRQAFSEPLGVSIRLSYIFRQEKDEKMKNMLDDVRLADLKEETIELLESRIIREDDLSSEKYKSMPFLYARNDKVDETNARKLQEIPGDPRVYTSIDSGDESLIKDSLQQLPKELGLKVGARVMLLKNLDVANDLFHGLCGKVKSFVPIMDEEEDDDEYDTGFGGNKAMGGLSNYISDNEKRFKLVPLVEFDNGLVKKIMPALFEYKSGSGRKLITATRTQIPLRLAWASSIHKSQGMTLREAVVDLRGIFEHGHAYVGLSRMREMEGIHLLGFDTSRFRCSAVVRKFYRETFTAQLQ